MGRTPYCGMAKDAFSGSFDSPSVASSLRVAQENRGLEFLSNHEDRDLRPGFISQGDTLVCYTVSPRESGVWP
jgi:hypothetical protein